MRLALAPKAVAVGEGEMVSAVVVVDVATNNRYRQNILYALRLMEKQ